MFRQPTTTLLLRLCATGNSRRRIISLHNGPSQWRLFSGTNNSTPFQRSLHIALWPPLVFAQLLLTLWAYKVRDFANERGLNYGVVLDVDNLPKQVNIS